MSNQLFTGSTIKKINCFNCHRLVSMPIDQIHFENGTCKCPDWYTYGTLYTVVDNYLSM